MVHNFGMFHLNKLWFPIYYKYLKWLVLNIEDFLLKNTSFKIGINNLLDYKNFDDTTFQNPGLTYITEISYKYDFK